MTLGQGRSIEILVVEDDLLVRMVATDILVDAGYRVIEARDASEALTLLEARGDLRAMFTDCNMPGEIDGLTLARLVQRRWPAIRVIVTSGKIRPEESDLPPCAQFLAKPYRASTLLRMLGDLFPQQEVTSSAAPVLPGGVGNLPPVSGTGERMAAAPLPEPDKS